MTGFRNPNAWPYAGLPLVGDQTAALTDGSLGFQSMMGFMNLNVWPYVGLPLVGDQTAAPTDGSVGFQSMTGFSNPFAWSYAGLPLVGGTRRQLSRMEVLAYTQRLSVLSW